MTVDSSPPSDPDPVPDRTSRFEEFDGLPIQIFPPRDDIHPTLHPFFDYWMEDCGGEIPLNRNRIDPEVLPRIILPWLYIVKVTEPPREFEYRLIGTGLSGMLGRDLTGSRLSAINYPPRHGKFLIHRLNRVVSENLFIVSSFDAGWADKDYLNLASLMIAGTIGGETTDCVFGITMRRR